MNFHSQDFIDKCKEQEQFLERLQNENDPEMGSYEPPRKEEEE